MNNNFKISIGGGSIDIISIDNKTEQKEQKEKIDAEKIIQNKYIEYMDDVVKKLKKMRWGDKINIDSEPHIKVPKKSYCSVTKNVRFKTYIFNGKGSKKILRYFMEKTKDIKKYGYTKILQIINSKKYRQFMPIKCLGKFLNIYKDEPVKNRYLFEVILSDQPCKPYLDIEWKVLNNNIRNKFAIFVSKLRKDIKTIFQNRYNITINDSNILISTSHSRTKVSFHIVINKYIDDKLVVYETNKKGYSNSCWDLWVALIEHDIKYKNRIDESVYSTDREFRTLYSNKINEFRPIVPYGTTIKGDTKIRMSTKKCLQYFVTYFDKNNFHYIKTPTIDNKYDIINKSFQYNIYSPKVYTDKKINELIKLIKPYHETVVYTGQSSCGTGWRFTYKDRTEPCYTGNIHKSNGFFVYENKEGYIYMKCLSSRCNSKKFLNNKTIIKKVF